MFPYKYTFTYRRLAFTAVEVKPAKNDYSLLNPGYTLYYQRPRFREVELRFVLPIRLLPDDNLPMTDSIVKSFTKGLSDDLPMTDSVSFSLIDSGAGLVNGALVNGNQVHDNGGEKLGFTI